MVSYFAIASASASVSASASASASAVATSEISLDDAIYIAKQNAYNKALNIAETNLGQKPSDIPIIHDPILTSTKSLISLILDKIIENNGHGSNIYGLPGAAWYSANDTIQTYIDNGSIKYIHASNEASSLYMASNEALTKDTVGITFSTSGPGTLMAMTGFGNALYEALPLISFFGVPTTYFQFIDKNIIVPVAKKMYYINSNTVNPQTILDDAFMIAKKGTPESPGYGPVAIFVYFDNFKKSYKYQYTANSISSLIYPDNTQNIINFSNKIFNHINSESKVIISIGERVHSRFVIELANLTNIYKNLFITLTLLSKTYINPLEYSNVAVFGPTQNKEINALYKNASIVIDCGDGIDYTLIVYADVYPLMNPGTPIFYIFNNLSVYPPASSTTDNTLFVDVNDFIHNFTNLYAKNVPIPTQSSYWSDMRLSETTFISNILTAYKNQTAVTDKATATTMSVIAQAFQAIYDNQKNIYKLDDDTRVNIIDDTLLYSTDIGYVAYLCNSFINCKNPMAISILGEFSPIGSSISVVAGFLRSKKYTGSVLVIGDGGFLNVSSYLVDLAVVMSENPNYSILILLMNDNCYSNVAHGEELLFGYSTSITSTSLLQKNIKIGDIIRANLGSILNNYLEINDLKSSSDPNLYNFITNWYINKPPGVSVLIYNTAIGQPLQIVGI